MNAEYMDLQVALQSKLDALKRNKEALSEEDIKGKYNKAFGKLMNEINQLKKQFLVERLKGVCVRKNDPDIVNLCKSYLSKVNSALFTDYSVEKAETCLEELVGILFMEHNSIQVVELAED